MRPQAIFIHGMWSRAGVWDRWARAFETAGYPCTVVALPGHGEAQTDLDVAGLGIQAYADAVAAVAADFERPILIGHSMGGLIAQLVATRTPIAAAVLINSAAPAPVFPFRPKMLPGLARHFAKWRLWRKAFRLNAWEAQYLLLNGLAPVEGSAIGAALVGESGRVAYELGFGSLNWTKSNYVDRARVECPLLALAGGRDRIVPIDVSRSMSKYYGNAMTFREYPDRAHWLLGEPQFESRIEEALTWLDATCSVGAV
jgi:pimeloyl-ACP methyl ester carboxylesterase